MPENIVDALAKELATQGEFGRAVVIPSIHAISATPDSMSRALAAMKQILEAREGISGSVLDKAVTMRDLLNVGALQLSIGGRTLGGAANSSLSFAGTGTPGPKGDTGDQGSPGLPGGGFADPRPILATPPALGDFKVDGGFSSVFVSWSMAEYQNHRYVEVYRAGTNSRGAATLIGTTTTNFYNDLSAALGQQYYYWARAVGITAAGVTIYGPDNAVGGTLGGRLFIGGQDFGPLLIEAEDLANGSVTASKLAALAVDATKFANGIEPVTIVTGSLPTTKSTSTIYFNGKLYRWDGSAYVASVPTVDLVGTITTAQIADAALTTAKFASSIEPITIVGGAVLPTVKSTSTIFFGGKLYRWDGAAYVASVATSDITGTLANAQIESLAASKITGQLTNAQLAALDAAKISGTLTDAQLAAISAAKITGQLISTQIADAAITTAKFAAGLEPVEILAALPGAGNFDGRMVYLTTDKKLYRYNGTAFVSSVPSTDITGQLTNAQLAAIDAAKLTGQITSTQITDDAITTPKIAAGAVTASEIAANTITAGQIAAGTITAAQIASDTITANQIATGAITANELAANSVIAGKVQAGAISATEIAAGAITVNKLLVVPASLCPDPHFADEVFWAATQNDALGWYFEVGSFLGEPKHVALWGGHPTNAPGTVRKHLWSGRITSPASGTTVRLRAKVRNESNQAIFVAARFRNASGTGDFDAMLHSAANTSTQVLTTQVVVPAGASTVEFIIYNESGFAFSGAAAVAGVMLDIAGTSDLIVDGAVIATKLAADSVIASKIAAGAVVADKIAANAVTTAKLSAAAVTANELAADSVVAGKIAANAVTATTIQAGSVTTAKIAVGAVTANEIAAATITGNQIASNTITAGNIAADTITAGQIAAGAISASEIAASAVVADKIATDAVTADKILANSITAVKIATDAVTADKVAANAITSDKIIANAITVGKIQSGAVRAQEIAAGAITTDKLLVTGRGAALNADPNTQDVSAWVGGAYSVVVDASSPTGRALQITSTGASTFAAELINIDATKTYDYRVWVKQHSGSSTCYLGVVFYDEAGNQITGSSSPAGWVGGSYHYFGLIDGNPTTSWVEYRVGFGPGESRGFASGARQMRPVFLGNYTGTGVQRFANPRITEKATADLIVDGSIVASKLAAESVVAGKLAANAIVANNIVAGTITGDRLLAGTITATQIQGGSITGDRIQAGTITSDRINVTNLAALSADLGTINAGSIHGASFHTGAYGASYAWPAAGAGGGVHLSGSGLLLGSANDGRFFQVTNTGDIYAPAFNIIGGSATYFGTLSAATGSLGTIVLAAGGHIRLGQTDWATGSGFFFGASGGATKISIGDSSAYLRWSPTGGLELKQNTFTASTSALTVSVSNGAQTYGTRSVTVSGGVAPYTYLWSANPTIDPAFTFSFQITGDSTTSSVGFSGTASNARIRAYVSCVVTDSNGRSATAQMTVQATHGTYIP